MNYSWQCRVIFIILVVILSQPNVQTQRTYATNGVRRTIEENTEDHLPADFVNFVKGLDSMVFKTERRGKDIIDVKPTVEVKMPTKHYVTRTNNNYFRSSQNSALRDILMLKLVSYYEDKYKVADETTPKPRVTDIIRRVTPRTRRTTTTTRTTTVTQKITAKRRVAQLVERPAPAKIMTKPRPETTQNSEESLQQTSTQSPNMVHLLYAVEEFRRMLGSWLIKNTQAETNVFSSRKEETTLDPDLQDRLAEVVVL